MKKFTAIIRDNETGEEKEFNTNGMLGAFINKEFGVGNSDTTQFLLGSFSGKELVKLLTGCMNMAYFTLKNEKEADEAIQVASIVAKMGFKQNTYRKGY